MFLGEDMNKREERELAPYASRAAESRGRIVPEDDQAPRGVYRGLYQRDRDRIIHSRAFRRLEYKTQVFVNHEGDHYRTRLTHTLEVSQISRTIARVLRLNEDLTEAIALAHDLGHTPFGHSGEDALRELAAAHGRQVVRSTLPKRRGTKRRPPAADPADWGQLRSATDGSVSRPASTAPLLALSDQLP